MTREEAKALAAELAKQHALALTLSKKDGAAALPHIEQAYALDRALAPTRLRAAEIAVVEAAIAWELETEEEPAFSWASRESEAIRRLLALREQARAEECQRETIADVSGEDNGKTLWLRCFLPRGHEGEHQAELGTWRWVS